MSRVLTFVLVADGNSDKALQRILEWSVRQIEPELELSPWVFRPRSPIARPLKDFVCDVNYSYRPDLVFVHRDAEKQTVEERLHEMPDLVNLVPVVPVRMTEAWLMIDEAAIRKAAGNPNGSVTLAMPKAGSLESLHDPKLCMIELLKTASERRGRRLQQFDRAEAARRVVDYIDDFRMLRTLGSFRAFESALKLAWDRLSERVKSM